MLTRIKRLIVGQPLTTQWEIDEKLTKWRAVSVLSSDALSSVAYATDHILLALLAFSAIAVDWSLPIALAISALLLILTLSYRQTIDAYPDNAGAYHVARKNLGTNAGLVAAAALLIDYVLTVAVSVSAGIENIASALPWLHEHREGAAALVILWIMVLNLRGIRDSATIFVLPTYFFVASIFVLLATGAFKTMSGELPAVAPALPSEYSMVPLILVLRAFAGGCAALTGIEAISNAVPKFQNPAPRNAKRTLGVMAALLAAMFLGITALAHVLNLVPTAQQTLISQLGRSILGEGLPYYVLQGVTAWILFQAANSRYSDFPRITSSLAYDRFLPRQLASVGDRLVFSNGVVGLSVAAIVLIFLFEGNTHLLIPLYAVGVFLSFMLSQTGMVVHHLREKKLGWRRKLSVSALGAGVTLIVLLDLASAKFTHGAWIVLLMIPLLVLMFRKINKHYQAVGKELTLMGQAPPAKLDPVKHTVIVPVSGIHRGVLEALRYAVSISNDVRACYVELDTAATERMLEEWNKWAPHVPFVVLKSPYRSVVQPILKYLDDVESISHDDLVTVVVPEFVTTKWWHRLLHNQSALFIRTALLFRKGKVVTSVRYHLTDS